jgi:hypothetical protein
MRSRDVILALLGGTLMAGTALADVGADANWREAVYKDKDGKDQTKDVITADPPEGYKGYLGLSAVAVNNDVVLKGDYAPEMSVPTIKVIVSTTTKDSGVKYTPSAKDGARSVSVPKGKLEAATVYNVWVEATIGNKEIAKMYRMNVGNPE